MGRALFYGSEGTRVTTFLSGFSALVREGNLPPPTPNKEANAINMTREKRRVLRRHFEWGRPCWKVAQWTSIVMEASGRGCWDRMEEGSVNDDQMKTQTMCSQPCQQLSVQTEYRSLNVEGSGTRGGDNWRGKLAVSRVSLLPRTPVFLQPSESFAQALRPRIAKVSPFR